MSSGPTPNFSLTILPISLCLSPGKLSELSLIQTPHLRFQDSLPTSACRDILNAHLQASCRSFHLSKHLTCVSRTHSQPQPVEIFLMLISKQVVGVFTCPNTSLVFPGLTPNFSLTIDCLKRRVLGSQLTGHLHQMTLQPTCTKLKQRHTV